MLPELIAQYGTPTITVEPNPHEDMLMDIGYAMVTEDLPRQALFMTFAEPYLMQFNFPLA